MNSAKWEKLTDDEKMFVLKQVLEASIAEQLRLYRESYINLFVDVRTVPCDTTQQVGRFFRGKFDPQAAVADVLIDVVRQCTNDNGLWVSERLTELLQSANEDYDDGL